MALRAGATASVDPAEVITLSRSSDAVFLVKRQSEESGCGAGRPGTSSSKSLVEMGGGLSATTFAGILDSMTKRSTASRATVGYTPGSTEMSCQKSFTPDWTAAIIQRSRSLSYRAKQESFIAHLAVMPHLANEMSVIGKALSSRE